MTENPLLSSSAPNITPGKNSGRLRRGEQKDQRRHSDGASRRITNSAAVWWTLVVQQEWNCQRGGEDGQLGKWRNKKKTLVVLRRWQKAKVSGLNGITRAVCLRRTSRFLARGKSGTPAVYWIGPSPARDLRPKIDRQKWI